MKILVVDDEKDARSLLKDLLSQAGHRVTAAESAIEAMALVQLESFDLAILDLMMPGVDGFQLTQFMSSNWNTFEIPMIVTSCRTDKESKSWARMCGCRRYLEKPFSPGELLDAVREMDQGFPAPLSRAP
jgi:two-component system phosphate regulon response regulator OmpR